VWPELVVVLPPIFDDVPSVLQIHKPVDIQTLVPQPTDEALGIGVFNRLSRPDEIQFDTFTISLLVQGAPVIDITLNIDPATLPEDKYVGQTISVTSEIGPRGDGGTQIIVSDLSQIEVMVTGGTGSKSLAPAADSFLEAPHQQVDLRLAPGDTFTVSLADYHVGVENRDWVEPEVIGEEVVELQGRQDNAPSHTWTFTAPEAGSCLVLFQTTGHTYALYEWSYVVAVEVVPAAAEMIPVELAMTETSYARSEGLGGQWGMTLTINRTYDVTGDLAGEAERVTEAQISRRDNYYWSRWGRPSRTLSRESPAALPAAGWPGPRASLGTKTLTKTASPTRSGPSSAARGSWRG
jgi:hypothetical protein